LCNVIRFKTPNFIGNKNDYEKWITFFTPPGLSFQWAAYPIFFDDDSNCIPVGHWHSGNFFCDWKEFFQLVEMSRVQIREGDYVKHKDPKVNENLKMLVISKRLNTRNEMEFFCNHLSKGEIKKDWFNEKEVTLFVEGKTEPHT
jgi:hypothetical protein